MLMSLPKEMINNPKCYVENPNGRYEPSDTATESEKKVIIDFVKRWNKAEDECNVIIK